MRFNDGCMGLAPRSVKGPCALGCDVRFGSYDVAIFDIQRPSPGIIVPRLVFSGKVEDEEVALFLQRQYKVRATVIDSRPDATVAARFQRECVKVGIKCWRAQYATSPTNRRLTEDTSNGIITLDRLQTLDHVFEQISKALVAFPQNYQEISKGEFVAELCSSVREPTSWHGLPTSDWRCGSKADHSFHALGYAYLAIELGKLDLGSSEALIPKSGYVSGGLSDYLDDEDEDDEARSWRRGGVVHSA